MMENQDRARVTMFLALLALVGIAVKFLIIAICTFCVLKPTRYWNRSATTAWVLMVSF
jgi:large-conductance mechanosensitive channel